MNDLFARWNLRPSERRLVVVVAVVFFIVVNLVWVVPHFSDWSNTRQRMDAARDKLWKYQREIDKLPIYRRQVAELEGHDVSVPLEDQAIQFARTVQALAAQSNISILGGGSRPSVTTNQFFIEQTQNFNVQGEEKNLVDFLYHLGSGNSMIRVRDMEVHPNPPRQLLLANIKVVASYQKNPPAKTAPPAPAPTAQSATLSTNQPKSLATPSVAPNKK